MKGPLPFEPSVLIRLFSHIAKVAAEFGPLPEIWEVDDKKAVIAGIKQRLFAAGRGTDIG